MIANSQALFSADEIKGDDLKPFSSSSAQVFQKPMHHLNQ